MAKQPPIHKAWISKKLIKTLVAAGFPWKPKQINRALTRLAKRTELIRTRTKHGRQEFRVEDVVSFPFTLDLHEVLDEDGQAIIMNLGWELTKLFNPESVEEAREFMMEAFVAVGLDRQAPRDLVWFSTTTFDDVVAELGDVVNPPQKTATFLANKLALLAGIAGCDDAGAPASITNLRTTRVVNETWLNVQDLVVLGQDEDALDWLRVRLHPNFGPKSMLLMQNVSEVLVHLYPVDPSPEG